MSNCERCGQQMPDTAAICPSCGAISSSVRPDTGPSSPGFNQPSSVSYEYSRGYGQQQESIYSQQPNNYPPSGYPPQPGFAPQSNYPPQPGYGQQPYNAPPVAVNVNVMAPAAVPARSNSGAVVVEVLLNLFLGIYGVGWLMAGETTTGVILLICSLVLYWPIVIVATILTLGLDLACVGPLAIGAIILNAILLNNLLKRKAASYVMVPTPPMQPFPPR